MGGKKKTLANRLARMTDEERARYLQHKADQEEEARRRKEQLIAMFMKNKIKKEDGFSRLNLSKINQHWHQILRLSKCKEMKEDVEHMKKYITRVVEYKNRVISKLMDELEMAEEQYSHNFQAHITHIDQTIASHEEYMALKDEQYERDLEQLLETSAKEHEEMLENAFKQHEHLKTVIFGQEYTAKKSMEEDRERYLKKKEDVASTFRIQLDSFIKQRERHCAAIWRQIASVINSHVSQTDARRLHLAELKRLDAESAAEIAANQERINLQEEEIQTLNDQYEKLQEKRKDSVSQLKRRIEEATQHFFAVRKQFRKEVEEDEKKLILLTDVSNSSIQHLEKLKNKGAQIVNLMKTCRKFETQREQVTKWLPIADESLYEVEEEEKPGTSTQSEEEMVKKIVISAKSPPSSSSSSLEELEVESLNNKFACLFKLENFWVVFNKADLDFKEMKEEKKMLMAENKHFRGMIRAVLEAAALDQSAPESKVSTRVASKRGARSAPLRRILV